MGHVRYRKSRSKSLLAKAVGLGFFALCVVLVIFGFFVPLQSRSGTIDTTANQCFGNEARVTRSYHLLLGQLEDYRLVRPHLLSAARCGQPATFKLYL